MADHSQPARVFRPDPHDYDQAQVRLDARRRSMQDFLQAAVRWVHADPDTALMTLAPMWPPARFAGRPATAVAYAVADEQDAARDQNTGWLGQPDLLPAGQYQQVRASRPFTPADELNPWYERQFLYRCGDVVGELTDAEISPYAVHVVIEDGREVAVRMTHVVQDVLFGPRDTTTPAWTAWLARREQRRREADQP